MKLVKLMSLLVILGLMQVSGNSAEITPESQENFNKRMQWFKDAKFGLFIHFGLYSQLGGKWQGKNVPKYAEWIQRWGKITPEEYIPLAKTFNPENLDADQWVKEAAAAGMKYMVITTKHHEGFCLWDSAVTTYDIGEGTKFDRDILGELKKACDKYGVKFGTYYSIIDWHHPSQRDKYASNKPPMRDKPGYVKYMKAQLKELIERYDPAIMWFDGDWTPWWTMEDGAELYNYLRELSPNMIINNRVAKRKSFKKDFGTPENSTPGGALDHVWEACWTINHSWGFKESDTKWKSHEELIRKKVDINAKGGNLLLNIGPKGDGSWPEACHGQLAALGKWNDAHKAAVYGAEYFDFNKLPWGYISQKKGSSTEKGQLYLYITNWPKDQKLNIPGLGFEQAEVTSFTGEKLKSSFTKKSITIDLPAKAYDQYVSVLKLTYSGLSKVKQNGVIALNGDELVLEADKAKLTGNGFKVSGGFIKSWTDHKATAIWDLNVPAPNTYKVKLVYKSSKKYAGSEILLTVDGQTVKGTVKATKGKKPSVLDLGSVKLNSVGATTCTVGFGDVKKKALIDLQMIILAPQD